LFGINHGNANKKIGKVVTVVTRETNNGFGQEEATQLHDFRVSLFLH
jgi:hypothetical protein